MECYTLCVLCFPSIFWSKKVYLRGRFFFSSPTFTSAWNSFTCLSTIQSVSIFSLFCFKDRMRWAPYISSPWAYNWLNPPLTGRSVNTGHSNGRIGHSQISLWEPRINKQERTDAGVDSKVSKALAHRVMRGHVWLVRMSCSLAQIKIRIVNGPLFARHLACTCLKNNKLLLCLLIYQMVTSCHEMISVHRCKLIN